MKIKNPKTILCCDDERDLCDLVAEELASTGHRVFCRYSGNEAIRLLGSIKVDLVLCDIKMADGDGMSVLKYIRAADPSSPVVLMTTGYSEFSKEDLLKAGAQGVFYKPVEMGQLIRAVLTHLGE